jgi:nucleotide-binding universal stress UspA family protein
MSKIRSILLHLDASARCEPRLQAARALAEQHDAEVVALYAAVPGALQFPYAEGMSVQLIGELNSLDGSRRTDARALFDKAVAGGLPRARWIDPIEDASLRDFSRQALYADLIVLGQRQRDQLSEAGVPRDFVESVLIDSGKPVLVVPYIGIRGVVGRTIVIAWKATRESARAVSASLPLLKKAEHVAVATWGSERDSGHDELIAFLGRHGITATPHHYGDEPGDIGAHILSAAADLDADLLVMGGYGHSRAREWILGGATRTILEAMTVPVLMSH